MFLKKIKDIKISNNEISTVRNANISVLELEKQISCLPYSGTKRTKDPKAERAILPPFIQVFYYLFFRYLKVPSEDEVFDTYLEWIGCSGEGPIKVDDKEYDKNSIRNRFLRTYPSLIRDLHFLYLLQESKHFDLIEYSMEKDYYNGLDLKIIHEGSTYYISLFIDTQRSNYYKKRKTQRHDYSEIIEIELKATFSSLSKIGEFYLLNNFHVQKVKDQIIYD